MKKLNRTMIEKLFAPHIYERGLTYYNRDRVQGLSFNKQKEVWFAEVAGTQDYYVEVDVSNMESGTLKTYCECPAFEMYDTCKHLVALLLEVVDQTSENSFPTLTAANTSAFIEGIISGTPESLNVMSDKEPMVVHYILTFERTNKVWLEIKTGIDHHYVVRNIRELLENILNKGAFFYKKVYL